MTFTRHSLRYLDLRKQHAGQVLSDDCRQPSNEKLKCVIIRRNSPEVGASRRHYILVVSQKSGKVFERVDTGLPPAKTRVYLSPMDPKFNQENITLLNCTCIDGHTNHLTSPIPAV